MKQPSFFVLGAPRCGTTSLATWLADHPQIYMSPEKEPHYFNVDHKRYRTSLASYERLFEPANDRHLAVGEASVWYLYSTAAVANILDYNPAAKFIVMVRNPVDMAYSLHDELLFTRHEDEADFAAAWRLQATRRAGRNLPTLVWEPKFLQYGEACSIGCQLARLYDAVPRDRVHVILFDDLQQDAGAVYSRALRFLGIEDEYRCDFTAHNEAKERRWAAVVRLERLVMSAKKLAGIEGGLGLWRHIEAWSSRKRRRPPLEAAVRRELQHYFEADIHTTERLVGRDLHRWLD
ncbi:MAG TPA: sulfotransferase [Stellaceae bacterium]|nr:sulfotransferase [Stellaceae bacterium]